MWINTNEIKKAVMDVGIVRGSQFWKKIERIDFQKRNGYAFEGDLLPLDRGIQDVNIEIGDLVLVYCDHGSTKYHKPQVVICEITGYDEEEQKIQFEKIVDVVGKDWAGQILANKEVVDTILKKLQQEETISKMEISNELFGVYSKLQNLKEEKIEKITEKLYSIWEELHQIVEEEEREKREKK